MAGKFLSLQVKQFCDSGRYLTVCTNSNRIKKPGAKAGQYGGDNTMA